eukprot:245757_1
MAEENKHHCNCQYSWVIDGALLRRILSAPPGHLFSSDEFSLDIYSGQIQILFKNGDHLAVVTQLLHPNPDQSSSDDIVMIHRGRTSVIELGQSYTELDSHAIEYHKIQLCYDEVIHRLELKEANLEQLTIMVDIQILSIVQRTSLREIVFNKPFAFSGSFQKQRIQCKVENTLFQRMGTNYNGEESDVYNGMWGFFYDGAHHIVCVCLRCYVCPPNVSKMDVKWSVYVEAFHVNETKTLTVTPHTESSNDRGNDQCVYVEDFDKVIQCESMTLEHVIEISKMYDMDGQEIKESDWKKHINAKKKKPKKAQFEYSWLIDTNLYEQWLSAEKGKCYSSRTFSLDGLDFQIKVYPKGNHEIDGCYVCVQCMSLPTDCTNVKCFTRIWCDALDFSCRKVDDLSFRKQGKYAQFDCMLPSRWKELMENNDGDNRDRKQDDKDGGILVLNVKFNILQMYRLTEKENILYQYPMNFGKSFQEQQFEWMIDADLMKRLKENVVKHGVFESPIFNDMWCLIIKRARGCVEKAVTDDEEDSDDDSDDDEEKEQGSDGKGDREKENIDYLQMRLALCGFPSSIQTVGIDWSLFVDPINVNKMTEAEVGISMRNPMKFIMIIPWDEFVKQNAESLTFFVSVAIWDMKDEDGDTLSVSAQADCIEKATKEIGFQTSNEEKEVEDQSDAETQEAVVRDLKQNDANVTDLDEIRTQMNALQEDVKVLKQQIVTLKEIDIKQMKKQMAKLSRNQQEDEEKEPSKEEMVRMWLKDTVKLPRYADQFINEGYDDLEMVADMTMDDLINLNIDKRGHRKKILKYANKLEFPNEMQPIPAAAYSQNADKVGVEGTNVYDTSKI